MTKATTSAWVLLSLLGAVFTAQAALSYAQEKGDPISEADLREIAHAYRTNRDKFNPFVIRYTHRIGTCVTEENAKLGKLDEDTCTAEVKWAFDGKRTCFVKSSPDGSVQREFENTFANAKGRDFAVPMSEVVYFHTPEVAFNSGPGAASFYEPISQSAPTENTPFDLGFMGRGEKSSPDKVILRNLEAKNFVSAERFVEGGILYVKAAYALGKQTRVECVFDIEKGYMLKRASYQVRDSRPTKIHVISRRKWDNGGWMPEHVVKYHSHNGKFYVDEWIVTDVKCTELAETDFEVTLPKGTQVNGPIADTSFNIEADTLVNEVVAKEYWEIVQGKKRVAAKPWR